MSEHRDFEWLEELPTDELRRRIYQEGDEYEADVLAAMKAELVKRYGMNIFENEETRLVDVMKAITADELLEVLGSYFSHLWGQKAEYLDILELLPDMEPILGVVSIELYPGRNALSGSGADWYIMGKEPDVEEVVELSYCPWAEWLGFRVHPEHLQLLGIPMYAMIALAHMTKAGLTEEAIAAEFETVQQGMLDVSEFIEEESLDDEN